MHETGADRDSSGRARGVPPRIDLIPLPVDAVAAGRAAADLLGDAAAAHPLLADVVAQLRTLYAHTVPRTPWLGYVARDAASGAVVGTCSFIVRPDEPSIEVAYFTFPPHEGRGVATAMLRALVRIAAAEPEQPLHAFTLPEPNASTRVLERCGFVRTGTGHDDEAGPTWRWTLTANPLS